MAPYFFYWYLYFVLLFFSINMVVFVLLGMPWNVSECLGMYPEGWKIPNDHMSLLHVVQKLKLNAVHKWWTAVNWRDFARRGVSPFLNGNSWFVKRRLSPPYFKRRLQPWPPCVPWAKYRQRTAGGPKFWVYSMWPARGFRHLTKVTVTTITFRQFTRPCYALLLNWSKWYSIPFFCHLRCE